MEAFDQAAAENISLIEDWEIMSQNQAVQITPVSIALIPKIFCNLGHFHRSRWPCWKKLVQREAGKNSGWTLISFEQTKSYSALKGLMSFWPVATRLSHEGNRNRSQPNLADRESGDAFGQSSRSYSFAVAPVLHGVKPRLRMPLA